jgi:hypothetical protein
LVPETTLVLSLLSLELLILEHLAWFSVEFDDKPGMLAYFVVSGCNGGNMTVDVGVSTTAAMLVIVKVAALCLFSEFCSLGCSVVLSTALNEDSLGTE